MASLNDIFKRLKSTENNNYNINNDDSFDIDNYLNTKFSTQKEQKQDNFDIDKYIDNRLNGQRNNAINTYGVNRAISRIQDASNANYLYNARQESYRQKQEQEKQYQEALDNIKTKLDKEYGINNILTEKPKETKTLLPVNKTVNYDSVIKDKNELTEVKEGDLYKLTKGKIDDRNVLQKIGDNVSGVVGNLSMGAESVVPSTIKYINSANETAFSKAGESIAKLLGLPSIVGTVAGEGAKFLWNQTSPIGQANKELNSPEKEKWRQEAIEENIQKVDNPLLKKLATLMPSIGQNAVNMAATAANPILGTALFMTSAAGGYLDDAKKRGMDDLQALAYSTVMGGLEGGTERVITGGMLSNARKLFAGKEISKDILQSYGVNVAENFFQEAIMEPLQEGTAQIIAGKGNDEHLWERSLESGVDGVISAIILGGASVGIGSAENLLKNANPTVDQIKTALTDTINSGKVNVNKIVSGAVQAIKLENINEMKKTENDLLLPKNENIQQKNDARESIVSTENKQDNIDVYQKVAPIQDNSINMPPIENNVANNEQKQIAPMPNNNINLPEVKSQELTTRNTAEKYANKFESPETMNRIVTQLEKIAEVRNKNNKGNLNIVFDDTINGNGLIEINGDNRTIRLNPESKKNVEFVLIHELSHDLKGTEGYNKLVDLVKQYNDGQVNYDKAYADIKNTYEDYYNKMGLDMSNLDINEEATNDILGTALGTQEFVNRITQQDRNFAQKIYDWIKKQINIYKSDNRELTRWLYKVQDNFEKALKQQNNLQEGTKNLILTDPKGYKYVKADRQVISGNNPLMWEQQVENYINDEIREGKDVHVVTDDGDILTITKDTAGKAKFRNEIIDKNGNKRRLNDKEFMSKLRAETHIDELAETSKHKNGPVPDSKNHSFAKDGFTYRTAYFEDIDGQYYKITMSVGKNGNINTIYNIGKMQNAQKNRSHSISELKGSSDKVTSDRISSINSIAPTNNDVNTTTKYSMQESENNADSISELEQYESNKKQAYKKIADDFGGGISFWEANLYDTDKEFALRFLKNNPDVRNKYLKDKNIKVESVYKPVELRSIGINNEEVQNFIKENDITVQKIANDEKLKTEYFNLVETAIQKQYNTDKQEAESLTKQWKDFFEDQKYNKDTTIWSLKRFESDFEKIKTGINEEIDNIATLENEKKVFDNSKEFEEYLQKYIDPLYKDKPQLSNDELNELAQDTFGTTNDFSVGAYMTTDGKLLNFRDGKSEFRSDHRDISSIGYNMQEFIDAGNIRMKPEGNGFELAKEPTAEQYNTLRNYIDSLNGEVYVEVDIGKNKYDGADYKKGTPTSKIISDLQYYFKNGKFPEKSLLADFLYSQTKKGQWNDYLNDLDTKLAKDNTRTKTYYKAPIQGTKYSAINDVTNIEKSKNNNKLPVAETNFEKYNRYKKNILDRRAKEVNGLISFKNESIKNIDNIIKEKEAIINSKQNKNTKEVALLRSQIENLKTRKTKLENLYNEKIDKVNAKTNKEKIDFETRNTIKQEARKILQDEISPLTRDLSKFKDKSRGAFFNRETAQRNIYDVVQDKELAQQINETIFDPIQKAQAQKTREINELFSKINELKLDKTKKYKYQPSEDTISGKITNKKRTIKVDEATLAQLLIEKKITDNDLRSNYNLSNEQIAKIHKASNLFTDILNYLYDQMNEKQIQYGYSPIGKRNNYFPHFFENKPDTTLGKIASYFGIDLTKQELPTEIAGKTDIFKPGKTFNSNTLERKTNKTDYDALKAMEKYISGAADIIYTTDSIQKLREFERQIRYQYSDKGIQENIDNILNNKELTQEAKDSAISGIFDNTEHELSNFVTWLNDYTNILANKKSFADRNMEHEIGRNLYSSMSGIESRIASNIIGGNLSVSLTNIAPIFQAMGTTKPSYVIAGMLQTTANNIKGFRGEKDTSFVNNSNFLTNRFGTDHIADRTATQKISDYASMPMNAIDEFTSESIVRAKYLENIDKGMTEEQALDNADKYAAKIMADRSKGALPIIFNKKNPLSKLVTMFQVEPNNIISNYFKDMPREAGSKAELVKQYTKLMVSSYAFNTLIMAIRGGNEVLPDPIRWVSYLIKAILGDDDDEKEQARKDLSESVIGSIPFASNIAGIFGMEDIGRIPISNATPNLANVVKIFNKENDSKYRRELAIKELSKPFLYLGLPTGGAQLSKTIQGIATINAGGSYKTNSKGEEELQFPVENANVADYIKAGVFGKYSLPLAEEYQKRNYKSLSAKQTKTYKESNIPYKEYLEYLDAKLKNNEEKINYLSQKNWGENQKWGIYKNDIFSSTEREDGGSQLSDAEYIVKNGISKSQYMNLYNKAITNNISMPTIKEYNKLKTEGLSLQKDIDYKIKIKDTTEKKKKSGELKDNQSLKDKDKINILINSNYTSKEKTAIYENYIKSGEDKLYDVASKLGVGINDILQYKAQTFESDKVDDGTTKGKSVSGSAKNKVIEYLNNQNISYNDKLVLLGMSYSLNSNQKQQLYNYIMNKNISNKDKFDIFDKMSSNFTTYKDGTVKIR